MNMFEESPNIICVNRVRIFLFKNGTAYMSFNGFRGSYMQIGGLKVNPIDTYDNI
jgi:hypothetical protein